MRRKRRSALSPLRNDVDRGDDVYECGIQFLCHEPVWNRFANFGEEAASWSPSSVLCNRVQIVREPISNSPRNAGVDNVEMCDQCFENWKPYNSLSILMFLAPIGVVNELSNLALVLRVHTSDEIHTFFV